MDRATRSSIDSLADGHGSPRPCRRRKFIKPYVIRRHVHTRLLHRWDQLIHFSWLAERPELTVASGRHAFSALISGHRWSRCAVIFGTFGGRRAVESSIFAGQGDRRKRCGHVQATASLYLPGCRSIAVPRPRWTRPRTEGGGGYRVWVRKCT